MEPDTHFRNNALGIIGMMSGTSLDGVDLAFCQFTTKQQQWTYQLKAAHCRAYPMPILALIRQLQTENLPHLAFIKKQLEYSQFLVETVRDFVAEHSIQYQVFSMHGHTVFHRPEEGLTVQIGNLNYIAAKLQIQVIGNFRELDVHSGGQGAPLAPFGEELFQSKVCINFGGICNVGYQTRGHDLGFCNLFFNHFSLKLAHKEFDYNGEIGRSGKFNQKAYLYFLKNIPKNLKSLSRQNFEKFVDGIESQLKQVAQTDLMGTYYGYLAETICNSVSEMGVSQQEILCTGGGAKNVYLIELLNANPLGLNFKVPDAELVDFKEAIIFAFLGLKFMLGQRNCPNGIGGTLVKGGKPIKGSDIL